MRKFISSTLGFILALAITAGAQEPSLAEAARKAREKKKDQPKATKVFTNDTLPKDAGRVSVVGTEGAPPAAKEGGAQDTKAGEAATGEKKDEKGETYWRQRFADARKKLSQAEKELELMQRELSIQQLQYDPDPNVVLREEAYRTKINDLRKKVDDKQAEIKQLRQGISDLEDELRRAGGSPAWARE